MLNIWTPSSTSLNLADHLVLREMVTPSFSSWFARRIPNFIAPAYSKSEPAWVSGVHPFCTAKGHTKDSDTRFAIEGKSEGSVATVWKLSIGYTHAPYCFGLLVGVGVGGVVGDGEGDVVGDAVGAAVGDTVGDGVGDTVGEDEDPSDGQSGGSRVEAHPPSAWHTPSSSKGSAQTSPHGQDAATVLIAKRSIAIIRIILERLRILPSPKDAASNSDTSANRSPKEGRKDGRKTGRKEGRKEGWMEGRKEGRQEGRKDKEGRKEGGKERGGGKERKKDVKEGTEEGRKEERNNIRKEQRKKGR
jgi:hypothetical protein